jgi:hypothetical protein
LTATTIGEAVQAVTADPLALKGGRHVAGSPALYLQNFKAGHPSAQNGMPGFFLEAHNDNQIMEVQMTQRALKGRRRPVDPRQSDFLALLGTPHPELITIPAPPATDPGAMDMDQRLRQLLNEAIKASPHSREKIAAMVSSLANRPITKPMIDCWTGAGRPHRFPADLIPAFCQALGNAVLLRGLAEASGCHVIERDAARDIRIAQLNVIAFRARAEGEALLAEKVEELWPLRQGGQLCVNG